MGDPNGARYNPPLQADSTRQRFGLVVATICATLVALSALFTKQHYILDVIAGVFLAFVAYVIFLRDYPREQIPAFDRRVAPALALCIIGLVILGLAGYWLAYRWSGETRFEFGP